MLLTHSEPRSGTAWTDSGKSRERRALKHRADGDTRPVPIHPILVRMFHRHLETFGAGKDGRIFTGPRGGIVSERIYLDVFHQARKLAFTSAEAASPLADIPYALRHAAVSHCSTPVFPPPKSPSGPGTALKCCSAFTPSASPDSRMKLNDASSAPNRSTTPRTPLLPPDRNR
jgi:hypothetical protein